MIGEFHLEVITFHDDNAFRAVISKNEQIRVFAVASNGVDWTRRFGGTLSEGKISTNEQIDPFTTEAIPAIEAAISQAYKAGPIRSWVALDPDRQYPYGKTRARVTTDI